MSEINLNPCPFCGSTDVRFYSKPMCVICDGCTACGPYGSEKSAIHKWNHLDRQRQDIYAEIEAAHLERELALAAKLSCAEEQRDSARRALEASDAGLLAKLLAKINDDGSLSSEDEYLDILDDAMDALKKIASVYELEASIRDLTEKVERLEKRKAVRCSACDAAGAICIAPGDGASVCRICHGTGAVIVDADSEQGGE